MKYEYYINNIFNSSNIFDLFIETLNLFFYYFYNFEEVFELIICLLMEVIAYLLFFS